MLLLLLLPVLLLLLPVLLLLLALILLLLVLLLLLLLLLLLMLLLFLKMLLTNVCHQQTPAPNQHCNRRCAAHTVIKLRPAAEETQQQHGQPGLFNRLLLLAIQRNYQRVG
jgi:hypothetical protein